MKSENVINRALIFKNLSLNFKRKKKTANRLYGTSSTSSKSTHGDFNSRLSWFSFIKRTSNKFLPTLWQSFQVSSNVFHDILSSFKANPTVNEKAVLKPQDSQIVPFSSSNSTYCTKNTDNNPPDTPKKEDFPKKETQDTSYLEQIFHDWFTLGQSKDKSTEVLEKSGKPVPKTKKTLISKSSLQQRSRFLVQSLNEAVSAGSQLIRLEEICKHLLLYPDQKTEMCKAGLRRKALHLKYYSTDIPVQGQAQTALTLIGYHEPPKGQGIRILSIDGGGTRKTANRLYGTSSTSSKSTHGDFNSRLSWFSFIKRTSNKFLPTLWQSFQVSSNVFHDILSSFKANPTVNEKAVLKPQDSQIVPFSSSNSTYCTKNTDNNPPDTPKKEDFPKKETQDTSYLEQIFHDWFTLGQSKDKSTEVLEKSGKPVPKTKKTLISKSSLQQRSRFLVQSLNEAVSAGSQLIRLEEICKHLLLYPDQKTEMCKAGLRRKALHLKYYSTDIPVQGQAQTALTLIGYHEPPKGQGIRILSIDGGGTSQNDCNGRSRGIMAIEVLRQLEARTNKRVHELFDYICGVSSGAILSLLLGALHLSLDECESLYRKLSDEVFCKSTFWGTGRLVWSHAYYDTTVWVNILKKTFDEKLLIETSKCKESPKIGVVSAIMNLPNLQPFIFRNYDFAPEIQSHHLGSCKYRMWESIRASGAAPGYFEEYVLDDYLHQDGGIIVNNPTAIGIHESRLLWPSEPIQCVLSLGSGRCIPSSQPTFTYTSLKTKVMKVIDSATDTEGTHVILNDLLSPYTYFRINPYVPEFFTLDENRAEKLDQMKRDVQMYLRRNEYKFESCAMTLCISRSLFKRAKDQMILKKNLYL